jgi:hypothetical protein
VATKIEQYRRTLRTLDDWVPYLRAESHLPGSRANLELVRAAGEEAAESQVLALTEAEDEFLVMCGAVGLGRLVAEGGSHHLARLRALASDDRWRVREAVALGLQRWGADDFGAMATAVEGWAEGSPLEQRAAIAALCEPSLLEEPDAAYRALDLVVRVTRSLPGTRDRTLRQALGYCWSVAVTACPEEGLRRFRELDRSSDPDILWIVRENAKKKRLARLLAG